jgi:predicted ATP-grasp superfamily ATP-dependent carboligase
MLEVIPGVGGTSALLTMASYRGTLAAARSLSRAGVAVDVADAKPLGGALWSSAVRRRLRCPPVERPDELIAWLMDFGRRQPGAVLYPTSDDLAWLFAHHAEALGRVYRVYHPPEQGLMALLDKRRLAGICEQLGVTVPRAWYPEGEEALETLAPSLPYPVVVKPRTQVFHETHVKGGVVGDAHSLRLLFRQLASSRYPTDLLASAPGLRWPLVQEFVAGAKEGVYSLTGFAAGARGAFGCLAALKVLQDPPAVGVGVCFENAPVEPEAEAAVRRICAHADYRGVFEVEFIRGPSGLQLIDFNPRYYGQMQFDISRGLDLPLLVHGAALGLPLPSALVHRPPDAPEGYCDGLTLDALHLASLVSGASSRARVLHWRRWKKARAGALVDPVRSGADPVPAWMDGLAEVLDRLRHPRKLLRSLRASSSADLPVPRSET